MIKKNFNYNIINPNIFYNIIPNTEILIIKRHFCLIVQGFIEKNLYSIIDYCNFFFEILWDSEFRSANFDVKMFCFFSQWHVASITLSFYDLLLKTRLLRDEEVFKSSYKKALLKRFRAVKLRETKHYSKLWLKYGFIDKNYKFII